MAAVKDTTYIEGIGRRKQAIARVRLYPATKGDVTVNERALNEFFPVPEYATRALEALEKGGMKGKKVTVKVSGGGISAQAEAMRLGTARALVEHDEALRGDLKKAGFLKRDPRVVERKKFGLKKARRAPQWSKR